MVRIIITLLLIYFAANLLLAITMMSVAFVESILKLSVNESNDRNKPAESTIEISSYAFGIALAASVLTFALSVVDGSGSYQELGHNLVGVFISVELGVMLLILVGRSRNKITTAAVSTIMFLGARYLLLPFGYWGGLSIPFIGMFQYLYIPVMGNVLDSYVVLFFIFLIPAMFKRKSSINTI